ncbi:hypothetical protein N7501_004788 [Penicillium viridicatum]|nr:hypothetical protein N7501_004788 [Penicillium viridicatum]
MVYYAYAKNSNDDWSWRYVTIAPSYDILNETKLHLGRSTAAGKEAPQFMNKLIFQLQNDNEGRGISTFNNHWNR